MKNIMIWIMLLLSITYTDAQNGKSPRKDYAKLANYDESKVPQYTLPSVLMCHDGEMVQTKEQWEQKRRPEILNLFTTYMFGKAPVLKHKLPCTVSRINEKALNGRATRKEITIQLTDDPQGPHIDLQLYLPNHVSGKIPVFLGISFMPNYTIYDDPDLSVPEITDEKMKKRSFRGSMDKSWQLDKILEHGYGLATFCYNDVDPDFDDDFQNGVHPYYYEKGQNFPDPDQWGSIAAWAWGMSRAMDYLETDKKVDAKKVAVIGHSRGNYKQFNDREKYLPFDQHELVALIAPRPIYIASAEEDNWSDQKGEFLGGKGAEPVYALYGLGGIGCEEMPPVDTPYMNGPIAYHNRKGPHAVLPYDWEQFLRFADKYFKNK